MKPILTMLLLAGMAAAGLTPLVAQAQTACPAADITCRVQHNDSAALGAKLDAILRQLQSAPVAAPAPVASAPAAGPAPAPVASAPASAPAAVPASFGTANAAAKTFTVAAGAEIADVLGAVGPGWTIVAPAGIYRKTWTTGGSLDGLVVKCATLGACTYDGQGGYGAGHRLTWGKACIHSYNNSLTVIGFRFINCGSPASGQNYSNEAAVYLDIDDGNSAHTLTVLNDVFNNNANGIFAAGSAGTVIIDSSVFGNTAPNGMNGYANGSANGPAHDMYLTTGPGGSVEVKGSYFYGSAAHNVKVRGANTNVHDNPVMTMDGGRVVDLAEGGKLAFAGNAVWSRDDAIFPSRTIQPGLKEGLFGNSNLIASGDETTNAGVPSGSITGNTFNVGRQNSTIWVGGGGMLTSSGNRMNLFGSGGVQVQGALTGDLGAASALPSAPAHAPAPPAPPSWAAPL